MNPTDQKTARVVVDAASPLHEVNRLVLGQNVEWYHFNHEPLWEDGVLSERTLDAIRELGPTSLRFPGGGPGDWYHWRRGIGPQEGRTGIHNPFTHSDVHPRLGTDELLDLCRAVGAAPWLQTNPVSESAESTADWARHCAARGPAVPHYELGNEIYLVPVDQPDHEHAEIAMTAEEYVKRAQAQLRALRTAAPDAEVGAIGGAWTYAVPFMGPPPGWNETVLAGMGRDMDFFGIHTVYAPVVFDPAWWEALSPETTRDAFLAAGAASMFVRQNLQHNLDMVDAHAPGLPLAVTEMLPLFGITLDAADFTGAMGSTMYTACVLHELLRQPRVMAAHFMAFAQPQFGSCLFLTPDGFRTSVHHAVLGLYARHLGDVVLDTRVDSPTHAAPAVGVLPAQPAVPTVDAFATGRQGGVAVFLVNRDLDRAVTVDVQLDGSAAGSATTSQVAGHWLSTNTPIAGSTVKELGADEAIVARPGPVLGGGTSWTLELPPTSVTVLELLAP